MAATGCDERGATSADGSAGLGTTLVMEKRLEELIAIGMKKGYVLYDEIDALLPEDYSDGCEIDEILSELARAGVEILEEPGIARDVVQPEVHDQSDPVEVYLLEVACFPL